MDAEGHSHISPEVLARYAADAAAEVRGVHTKHRHGSKATARVHGEVVDVHVAVDFGANIPTVAADVQRRVGEYLAQMADVRPRRVNVIVDDVVRS
jgi:uncharacterized alkaline shock family protein YloU